GLHTLVQPLTAGSPVLPPRTGTSTATSSPTTLRSPTGRRKPLVSSKSLPSRLPATSPFTTTRLVVSITVPWPRGPVGLSLPQGPSIPASRSSPSGTISGTTASTP